MSIPVPELHAEQPASVPAVGLVDRARQQGSPQGAAGQARGSSPDQGATPPCSWNRSTWDRPTRNPAALIRATVSW
jgi:hypothetical protein